MLGSDVADLAANVRRTRRQVIALTVLFVAHYAIEHTEAGFRLTAWLFG